MAAIAVEHQSFGIRHAKVKGVAFVMGLVTSDSTHPAFAQLSMHIWIVISFILSCCQGLLGYRPLLFPTWSPMSTFTSIDSEKCTRPEHQTYLLVGLVQT